MARRWSLPVPEFDDLKHDPSDVQADDPRTALLKDQQKHVPPYYGAQHDRLKKNRSKKRFGFLLGLRAWRSKAEPMPQRSQRLIDRSSHFQQSFGRWNIGRNTKDEGMRKLFSNDWFHTVLHMTTWKVLGALFLTYLAVVTVFAALYLAIARFDGCNLGIVDYREAYYFSLETMTTVGFGTQDVFFGRCWSVMVIITAQACSGLLIDALLIGLLFARLGRPQTRASTVVFSDKAVLRRIRGEYYFMFQVAELRKHQLLETHVRCYAVRHHRTLPIDANGALDESQPPETVHYQTHNMRLQHPDDELGGSMLLVLPQLVVHRVDAWSPLMPPPRWVSSNGIVQWGIHEDCDWERAPWEAASPEESPTSGSDLPVEKMIRRQTAYWDNVQNDPGNSNEAEEEKGPGYVYKFPDLLKRWDDVDGERGTWYERMKRRCLLMEQMRQERVLKAAMRARALGSTLIPAAAALGSNGMDCAAVPAGMGKAHKLMKVINDDELGKLEEAVEQGMQRSPSGASMSMSPGSPRSDTSCGESASIRSSVCGGNGSAKQQHRKNAPMDAKLWFAQEERRAIDAYLKDRELEVVVILEGIDTSTGSTVQCRHSYAIENMAWDHTIAPCVTKDLDGKCVIDFTKFHDIRPAPPDCIDSGFVQSYA